MMFLGPPSITWQNADELPDELDRPCPKCGGAIVGAECYAHSALVLCCSGHVHTVVHVHLAEFVIDGEAYKMTARDVVVTTRMPWRERL